MSIYRRKAIVFMLSAFVMLTIQFGCAQNQNQFQAAPAVQYCTIPSGHLVDEAFEQAKSTLSRPDCVYRFDEIFKALLNIAEGAPDEGHKQKFYELLEWSRNGGLISKVSAQEYYTRYFHHMFYSLPREYQTCSYCPRLSQIMKDLQDELKQKAQGLNRICKDKIGYAKAAGDLQTLDLILEATCKACESQD